MAITPELEKLQKLLLLPADQIEESAHHAALARFDDLGGYQLEARARRILAGLAFRERDLIRPLRELSGGWVMRAHLARLLTLAPDLLLLDEPTNHLDLESLVWFQEHLQAYARPPFSLYLARSRIRSILLCGSITSRWNAVSCIATEETSTNTSCSARPATSSSSPRTRTSNARSTACSGSPIASAPRPAWRRAQSKLKEIARIGQIRRAGGRRKKTIHFRFPQPRAELGLRVISLRGVHHAYGENVVYRGIDFEAERGLRMVLVGPNGAGKSTLLKLLAGVLDVQQGERDLGYNASVGYYSQNRVDMLQPKRTVLEEASDTREPVPEQAVRTILGSFLFRGDDVFKPVAVLSGGEKSRLALVKLLLDPPNLLLMDEPTNPSRHAKHRRPHRCAEAV